VVGTVEVELVIAVVEEPGEVAVIETVVEVLAVPTQPTS
jgi:hypothetical protein